MKNPFNTRSLCAAALLLALAPCARPAFAQSEDVDDNDDMDQGQVMKYPQAINYPQAIPGGLDLFHYTDYTQTKIKAGSAADAIEKKMRKMDAKTMEERMMRESLMTDAQKTRAMKLYPLPPLAFNYPQAIPGGLDLFHYTDFTGTTLMEGSAADMISMQMRERDEEIMGMMPMSKNMGMIDMAEQDRFPFPLNYPQAIPGGLDLFHYTDYTQTGIEAGSAADAIEMKMKDADEKKMMDKK